MAQENKLIRWANDRFPPIDLNNEIKPLIELIGKVKELEERNKVLEKHLKRMIPVAETAKLFDEERTWLMEAKEALSNNQK